MERKYYLRGLGLGIAMTAIIMGVALSGHKTMTDEEIIARAKELGMVENTVLADRSSEDTEDNMVVDNADDSGADSQQNSEQVEPNTPVKSNVAAVVDENEKTDNTDNTGVDDTSDVSADGTADAENDAQEDITDVNDNGETEPAEPESESVEPEANANEIITSAAIRTITVNSGDGSYAVARKLADVGVVTSAETFDTFLCQNGYDKRLRPGTFSIPADASDEQIARIVTGAE